MCLGGLVYVVYGVLEGIHGGDPDRRKALGVLGYVSPHLWAILWIVVGVLAILSSRWPPNSSETWGYTALTMLSALWASGYVTALVFLHVETSITGSGGLTWTLVGILWWGISGLRNPDEVTTVVLDPHIDGPPSDDG